MIKGAIRRNISIVFLSAAATLLLPVVAPHAATKKTNAVYVAQNQAGTNSVAAFIQNRTTGLLTLVDTYSTGDIGDVTVASKQSHALASNGKFLFVTNSGDHTITSFRIGNGGVLNLVGGYSSEGYKPVSLAVKGSRLIVVNQGSDDSDLAGNVRVFKIKKDGSLSVVTQAHFDFLSSDTPVEVVASQSSSIFSVGLSGANRIDHFILNSRGAIVRTDSVTDVVSPLGATVQSASRTTFVYTLPSTMQPGVVALRVDENGRTDQMYQDIREDLSDPSRAAIHPNGKRVWVSAFETRALSMYAINKYGVMTALSDYTPVASGPGGADIAVDSGGLFLFRLRGFDVDAPTTPLSPVVDTLRVGSAKTNAGLSLVQTVSLPASWATTPTTGIAVVPVLPLP
jgi:6-phosphogluconolactonase (cycloisomerase 2 family)